MKITPSTLQGIYEIHFQPKEDHRGQFTRIFDSRLFAEHGLVHIWVQENRSVSLKKGTVRGLHFQAGANAETKLIRVSKGAIYDVFVDLRPDSPTFGAWDAVLLTEDNDKMLYISKGFAHGFCSLTDDTEVIYKVDSPYHPPSERGILWNDKTLGITWPVLKPILSEKDQKWPTFEQYQRFQER
jgi:dTDP-4-dehydrorhamnose 3,5-epimerase